ncbi:hypothetical protein ACFLU6_11210, partial [Acidobacteriota bacterium]
MTFKRLIFLIVLLCLIAGRASWLTAQVPGAPLVRAYLEGNDIVLEWDPVPDAVKYNIYASMTKMDLCLGMPSYTPIGQTTGTTFVHVDGAAESFYYYYILGENASMAEGDCSNIAFHIGFEFVCAPGSPCKALISFPYFYYPLGRGNPGPATAEDLCGVNPNIITVTEYLGQCQDTGPPHPCGTNIDNFELIPGKGYIVEMSQDTVLQIVGSHDPCYHPGSGCHVTLYPCG